MYRLIVFFLHIFIFMGASAQSATQELWESNSQEGKVSFLAIGNPSFLQIEGVGRGPEGKIHEDKNGMSGHLSFDLNSLNTGIDTRDEHMKEKYLKTQENPRAFLEFAKQPPILSNSRKGVQKFYGKLTLNSKTKQTVIVAKMKKENSDTKTIEAEFKILLSDFDIAIPSFAGITVANEIVVQSTTVLLKKPVKEPSHEN